ncbi:MAG: glycosyltransferase family 39 protein [Anaerolineae bacterium]|nr:glycosyltransferase family 39 protein [Anaerolineae bacterium]
MLRKRAFLLDVLLCLVLFVGAWLLRALSANAFITWDEPMWTYRSTKFLLALQEGRWRDTLLVGHPGVLTMWGGALGLLWGLAWGRVSPAQLRAVAAIAVPDVHNPQIARQLGALLPAAKGGVLFFHALAAVAFYLLVRRLLGRRSALAASILLGLDPYYLALGRVLHIDALAAEGMLLALLSLLLYLHEGRRRYLILAGAFTALGTLAKAYGLFILPVVFFLLLAGRFRRAQGEEMRTSLGSSFLRLGGDLLLFGIAALLIFALLWPAVWVSPLRVAHSVVGLSFKYATKPGDATASFFRGQVTTSVGKSFYPLVLFFRSTPLALLGGLLALGLLLYRPREEAARKRWAVLAGGFLFVLCYVLLVSLSRKKFDRYILPALVTVDLLAALGLLGSVQLLTKRLGRRLGQKRLWLDGVVYVALLVQGFLLLKPLFPAYYLAYYNPLAGGIRRALQVLPVGWGEGIEQAAKYLAAKPAAEQLTVATWAIPGMAPYFPGDLVKPTEEGAPQADYILFYVGDVQTKNPLATKFVGLQSPEYLVRVQGVPYVWVYRNAFYEGLVREIDQVAKEGEGVILLNAPSAFERHYQGKLPCCLIQAKTEEEVALQLQRSVRAARQIFYIAYRNTAPQTPLIEHQLSQNAILMWTKPFLYGELRYYLLPEGNQFAPVYPASSIMLNFGNRLLLERYGLSSFKIDYRQELGLSFRWRALQKMNEDYHIFLHFVDGKGRMWGQGDALLQSVDQLKTSQWVEGETYLCRYTLSPQGELPPGYYWVVMGLYRLSDMARLDVLDRDGQRVGTAFRIGPVFVTCLPVPLPDGLSCMTFPMNLPFGSRATLVGYDLPAEQVESGDKVEVVLYWRCQRREESYELELSLEGPGGTVASWHGSLTEAAYPVEHWPPAKVIRYPQELLIPPEAPSGTYTLTVALRDARTGALLGRRVPLGAFRVFHRERLFTVPEISFPRQVRLGERILFLGYDLPKKTARPGETLSLTLYWRALERPRVSYKVFVHLLDGQEIVRGQRDSFPQEGKRLTTDWVPNEIIIDHYTLPISPDAPQGIHRIEIGMYDPLTEERLPVVDERGQSFPQRRLLLEQEILVQR